MEKMSLQHLQSSVFTGLSSPPPPPFTPPNFGILSSHGESKFKSSNMGFQVFNTPLEQHKKSWCFQPSEGSSDMNEINGGDEGYLGNEKNGMDMVNQSGVEEEGKETQSGQYIKLCTRGHWRPAEDAKLKELVSQYGPQNWNLIAEKLQGRSGKSCRLRWFNQLDPRIDKRAFSEEEEERLLAAHRLYGNKWAMISRFFPGRTDNAVKNHWHVIMARKQRNQSSRVYGKRKPSSSSSRIHERLKMIHKNNACSDQSTITSNKDESVSTCTNPSFKSSSSRVHPGLFNKFSPQQHHQPCEFQMGLYEENMVALRNGGFKSLDGSDNGFYHTGSMVMVMGLDQTVYSDSNSDVSVTESVDNNMKNLHIEREIYNVGDKINQPFIDFLGVGAN